MLTSTATSFGFLEELTQFHLQTTCECRPFRGEGHKNEKKEVCRRIYVTGNNTGWLVCCHFQKKSSSDFQQLCTPLAVLWGSAWPQWLADRTPIGIQVAAFAGRNYALKDKKNQTQNTQPQNNHQPSSQSFLIPKPSILKKEIIFFYTVGVILYSYKSITEWQGHF